MLPYLFGYNGMMKDNHVAGEGNAYYTLFREYDPDLGRWWRPDPIFQPWQSPYSAFDGNPIMLTDVWGLESAYTTQEDGETILMGTNNEKGSSLTIIGKHDTPISSEPTFGPSGGGIGFYEAEDYAGRLPATTHSLSGEGFTAGDYSIGAQRNANGIQYFTAGRQVGNEFRIEYVIEANQLKTFLRDIRKYAYIANTTYSKGYLTDADKEILAGNMFTGILKMWGEALTSPEWWVYAITSHMDIFESGAIKGATLPLRQQYINEVLSIKNIATELKQIGLTEEAIARYCHSYRRQLGIKYKDLTPPAERARIYERNISDYGDKLGPTVKWLRARGKTWGEIIESSSRPGGKNLGY